ncbi:MAG: arylsulfatase A-like enzyme [Planctomycetota bacterium]|jgi:arylsulfatase A-like enzyme
MHRTVPTTRSAIFALSLTAILFGCAAEEAPLASSPNVVIIVLDTVRADHLSSYGYELDTTPNIDALCDTAVRYTRCRATGPWTLPSHASIFTGLFAFQHHARTEVVDGGRLGELPLSQDHVTLAEVLGEVGYRTGAFVANAAYLREEFQLDQGFESYVVKREPALEKNPTAFEWLGEGTEPFFMFLNYMDAHRPYNTRPFNGKRADLPLPNGIVPSAALLDELYNEVMGRGLPPTEEVVQELRMRYDIGIANADLAVGEVIEYLKKLGQWENTLLIVTSDHGEFFGEHGLVEHSKDIYEEVLHVPLVCKYPETDLGSVNDNLISLADIPGIVLEVLPAEFADSMREQFPLDLGRNFSIAEASFSRGKDLSLFGERFRRERRVIYFGKHKFIRSSDGQHELYDLDLDPSEKSNLYAIEPKVAERLSQQMLTFMADNPGVLERAAAPKLSAEGLKALHDLGYLGNDESESDD